MAQYEITITAGPSINWFTAQRKNGVTQTITTGQQLKWKGFSELSDYVLITAVDPDDDHTYPVYFERSTYNGNPSYYKQNLNDDPYIYFTADKSGVITATKKAVQTYTISYNANGGSGAPANQTKYYNVALTLSTSKPTRTGYTFVGWSTSPTSSDVAYNPGGQYVQNVSRTLYAVWIIKTYTISYNANGGSNAPSDQTKTYNVDLTLTRDTPTWDGHIFLGWGTSPARDAERAYAVGDTYKENVSRTLYAIWAITAYFYSKGSLHSQESARINGKVTMPTLTNTATEGCKGWLNNGETFPFGAEVSISSNTYFTAVWKNIYRVTYDANGGSNAPSSQTKWQDEDLTLTSSTPTWANHSFLGWSTSSARDAEIEYHISGTYTENKAITLYAVWIVTATFYSKDAVYSQASNRIGKTVVCPTITSTETEVLTGWRLAGDDDIVYQPGETIPIIGNITLYAIWENGYKLTYRADDADSGSTPSPPLAVTYTISPCGFIKNGYYFQYWRTASGTKYYPGDSLTPTRAMILYAQWKARVHFCWHGNDATDNARFAAGQKIDKALTADAWNSLCDFINDVRTDARMPTVNFHRVTAGEPIRAVTYNIVRNAIYQIVLAGYGDSVPATVSTGDEIVTSLFVGRDSLKYAINRAVDQL